MFVAKNKIVALSMDLPQQSTEIHLKNLEEVLSVLNTDQSLRISIDGTVSLQERHTGSLLPRNNDAVADPHFTTTMMSCCFKHGPQICSSLK